MATSEENATRIRAAVIRALERRDGPVTTRELHRTVGAGVSRGWVAEDVWAVLDLMVRDGTVWHEQGKVSLNVPATNDTRFLRNRLPESQVIGVIRRDE